MRDSVISLVTQVLFHPSLQFHFVAHGQANHTICLRYAENRSQLSFRIKRVLVEFVRFDNFFRNFHNIRLITGEVPSERVRGPGFWLFLGHEGSVGLCWFGEKGQRSFLPGSWQRERASVGPRSSCEPRAQKWHLSLPLTLPWPSQGRSNACEHTLEKDSPMIRGMASDWAPPYALGHR